MRDQELAVIKGAIKAQLAANCRVESLGTVAAEQALACRGFLTLVDVKLALLRRIGRGVEGVFAAYVRALRTDGVRSVEPVSGTEAVEADVHKAACALLDVLCYREGRRSKYGAKRCFSTELAEYFYYIWRRSARYGYDTDDRSWRLYLFDGARYYFPPHSVLSCAAKTQLRAVVRSLVPESLLVAPRLHEQARADAAVRFLVKLDETELGATEAAKAFTKLHAKLQDTGLLVRDGRMSPVDFERAMDTGSYIGMKNGVFDLLTRRFIPKWTVPRSVLVSMSVDYEYGAAGSTETGLTGLTAQYRAEINEFYRTLFASDYNDPNDASLARMWRFMGSLVASGAITKPRVPCIFLGTDEGDNGKSAFTNLIHATLGDYSIPRVYIPKYDDCRLVCSSTVLPRSLPGDYQCGNVQAIFHASPFEMPAAFPAVIAHFGSVFVAGLEEADTARRLHPRDPHIRDKISKWAPVHFAMMLEASAVLWPIGR